MELSVLKINEITLYCTNKKHHEKNKKLLYNFQRQAINDHETLMLFLVIARRL